MCVQTMKALARPCRCASLSEPALFAHVISTVFIWAVSYVKSLLTYR